MHCRGSTHSSPSTHVQIHVLYRGRSRGPAAIFFKKKGGGGNNLVSQFEGCGYLSVGSRPMIYSTAHAQNDENGWEESREEFICSQWGLNPGWYMLKAEGNLAYRTPSTVLLK